MPSVNLLNMEKDIVTDRLNSSFRNCSDASNSIVDGLSSFRANSMNFNSFSNSLDAIGSSSNGSINYSAFVSPCQNSKLSFNLSNSSASHLIGSGDFRSLQNSPFYNHYPGNSSNISEVDSPNNNNLYSQSSQNSTQKNFNSNQVNNIERILKNGGPQRELFTQQSLNSNGLRYQDRLYYYSIAQSQGYIVGLDLERIKENSRRSMSQTYGRISAYFRNRYGETEAKTKASYLQLGVRVPSKDHVSEIVGKGGQKIKLIREETGALITTPGENEEHVFIIEAPPEIALNVANHLTRRAQEITQSKLIAGDRRRGSAGSGTPGATQSTSQCFTHNLIGCPVCVTSNGNGISQSSMPNSPANNNGIPINSNSNGSISMLTSRSSSNNLSSNSISNGAFNTNGGCTNGDHSNSSSPPLTSAANFNRNTTLTSGNGSSNTITNCVNSLNGTNNGTNNNNSTITSSRILLARGRISVPQDMVGKIIGTQGSIITTIQKDTGTEIKSPPKEAGRGPDALADFEISAYQGLGLTSAQAAECRVQQAKQLIGHLVMRQLERRTSDDIDEVILTPGSERGTTTSATNNNGSNGHLPNTPNGNGVNGNSCNGQNPQNISWMWPDVAQMDSNEAREVLDRILAESKSKTRRVKEVCSVGNNSPNDCFQNPNGSSLNGTEVWIQNAVAAAAASNNNGTNGSNGNLPGLCSSQLGNGQRFNDLPMHGLSHYQQMAKSSLPSSPLRSNGIDSNLIDPFSNHQLCMQSNNNSVLNRYYMQSPGAGNGNGLLDSDNEQKNSNFSSLEQQGPANFLDNDFARLWNSMGISQTTMNNKNGTSGTSEGSDYCQTSGAGSVDENKSRTTNGNIGAIGDGRRRSTPPSSENNFGRTSNSTSTSSSRGESLGDHFNHQMYINSTNNTANSVLSKLFLQSPPISGTGSNVQDFENSPNDYNDNNSCVLIQF